MTYVLAQLAPLGALVAACCMVGLALERWTAPAGEGPELRALARVVLGTVAWMLALFVLASVGALGAAGVAGLGIISLGLAWAARRPGSPPVGRGALPFLAAATLLTLPLTVLALGWDVSWDASAYHLTVPKHYLAAGGFAPMPGNVYSNWPLATELLYAALLSVTDHPAAKALHAAFGLATLFTLWVAARAFHREAGAWIAAPLVLMSPLVRFEWSIAYVDLAYAFFFTAGIVFAVRAREDRRALWLVGICGGALAGIKVNGVLGAAALGVALLPGWIVRARADGVRAACADAARFAAPVALLWLPWLAKSAAFTGNPLYPLFFGVFGGPDWSARLSEQFLGWQRSIGMGRDAVDFLLLPWRLATEAGPGYARFEGRIGAHWLAVVPLAGFAWRHAWVRTALLASAAYFVLWAAGSQQARFLVPILPALALCGSIGALEAVGRVAGERARLPAALALAAIAAMGAAQGLRDPAQRAFDLAPRLAGGAETLRAGSVHPVYRFVASLPQDAKLLLVNTNQAFFLERPYESDSFFEASQLADRMRDLATAESVLVHLRERGITHVLRSRREWGIAWPPGLEALLRDPQRARPRYRAEDGRYEVFALVTSP